jgi:hypothetical protein
MLPFTTEQHKKNIKHSGREMNGFERNFSAVRNELLIKLTVPLFKYIQKQEA